MRVLLFTQYYRPEITAAAMRTEAFVDGLIARGHEVDVICEVPSHPQGVIDPAFRGRTVFRSEEDGARVRRVWVYARPRKAAVSRIANYASYALVAAAVGFRGPRPDVVLASSPPLPVGSAAAAVARRFGVPWVLDVRDLWPDIAVVLGQVPDGPPLELARRLERGLYRSASRITAVTEPFRAHIEANGGEGKVSVIYNGTSATYLDAAATDPDRRELGIPADRFVLGYAGNLGIAQGLEAAVEAAGSLGDDFQLLVVGDGPRRARPAGDGGTAAARARAVPGPGAAGAGRADHARRRRAARPARRESRAARLRSLEALRRVRDRPSGHRRHGW